MLLIATLVLSLVFSGTATSFAAATTPAAAAIRVIYDGNYISFKDAVPKIINGRTMVPFRQILEEIVYYHKCSILRFS